MQRRVRIASSNTLDECAGDVIVLIPIAVVDDRGLLHCRFGFGQTHYPVSSSQSRRLQAGERPTRITSGGPHEMVNRFVADFNTGIEPTRIGNGPAHKKIDVLIHECPQDNHHTPGQQRRDHRK